MHQKNDMLLLKITRVYCDWLLLNTNDDTCFDNDWLDICFDWFKLLHSIAPHLSFIPHEGLLPFDVSNSFDRRHRMHRSGEARRVVHEVSTVGKLLGQENRRRGNCDQMVSYGGPQRRVRGECDKEG